MNDRRRLRPTVTAVPILRISCLLIMLAVIGVTIYHFDVGSGAAPAPNIPQNAGPPKKPASASPKNRKPAPDENAAEFQQFVRECDVILDGSTSIRPTELRPYWRVLNWVDAQSIEQMSARPAPEPVFQFLKAHSNKYRGQLFHLDMSVDQVTTYEVLDESKLVPVAAKGSSEPAKEFKESKTLKNLNDSKPMKRLYEIWGLPKALDGWYFVVVTPELPPGIRVGRGNDATVSVYGYFFKLQGYQPFNAKPTVPPQVAPLLVGRIATVAIPSAPTESHDVWSGVVLIAGGAILVLVVVGWIFAARRKPPTRVEPSLTWPDSMDDVDEVDND